MIWKLFCINLPDNVLSDCNSPHRIHQIYLVRLKKTPCNLISVQKVQEEEKHLLGTVNDLNQSLTDSQHGSQTLQEKLTQYHKRLNSTESEGRVLNEKLAALQQSHSEQEDLINRLQERMATLQNNLTDNEVQKIRLEGQVRNLQLTLQQKDNLIEDLNSKIEELKGEKEHLNKVISQTEHSAMQVMTNESV